MTWALFPQGHSWGEGGAPPEAVAVSPSFLKGDLGGT